MEQRCGLQSRLAGADYGDVLALEGAQVGVRRAVRSELGAEFGKYLRHVGKVAYTDSKHDAPRLNLLTRCEPQQEPTGDGSDRDDVIHFQVRYEPLLERLPI